MRPNHNAPTKILYPFSSPSTTGMIALWMKLWLKKIHPLSLYLPGDFKMAF